MSAPSRRQQVRIGGGVICGVFLVNTLLLRNPFPTFHYEPLPNAIRVEGWTTAGLKLADGRTVMLRGMTKFPAKSDLVSPLTSSGVEVAPNGDVFCRVNRWIMCGNDPMLFDLRRINVRDFLAYARQGEFKVEPLPDEPKPPRGRPMFARDKITSLGSFERFQKAYQRRCTPTSL